MLNLPFLLTTVIVTLAMGVGLTAWVRTRRRRQLEIQEGIRSLAAMRWREFSRFIIEALQAQGFEAARGDAATQSAQESDLVLTRNGQTWLLSVKQGANYRITGQMVDELDRAVRFRNAEGGIFATLGTIDQGARIAHPEIELLDGAKLWSVVEPLLPPSLQQDIKTRAQSGVHRESGYAMGVALIAGLLVGAGVGLLTAGGPEVAPDVVAASPSAETPAPATAPAPAPAGNSAPAPAPVTPSAVAEGTPIPPPPAPVAAPADEQAEREIVQKSITTVQGVERAAWTSRSTLVLYMSGPADASQVQAICALIERHDSLRATRLQLQQPPANGAPVRFLQCKPY